MIKLIATPGSRAAGPIGRALIAAAAFLVFGIAPARADRADDAKDVVADATDTLRYFASDRNYSGLWDLMDEAKALVVIPKSVRAGFIFGGSGGNGVMIARGGEAGWSEPVFFRISAFSFGLQAGGEVSEVVLVVMTDRGVRDLLNTSVKLGADMSVAAGPVGGGAKAATVDVLAYSRSQGVYGGVTIEGGVLKVNNKWNEAYYGQEVEPRDIIERRAVSNSASAPLIKAAALLATKD